MRLAPLTFALSFLILVSLASVAHADVARCGRCSTSGLDEQGGLAAVMVGAGASALLVGRLRRRRR